MNAANRDRFNALFCGAVVLLAIALTWPFVESGVNDDWSYTKTALDLAQTGQLRYNGWAAAMVGAQAYWGALFIKLFGFSFLTTRMSTAPLAAGCALLLYALHRRTGLSGHLSIFGTLTVTLSPVFIPHAASFMTEVPGMFLFLLSVFGYVRAVEPRDLRNQDGSTGGIGAINYKWLVAATIAGLLAGSVRQAFWVLPVLAPLYLIIGRQSNPSNRRTVILLFLLSLLSLALAVSAGRWFYAQPYAIHERVTDAFHILRHGKVAPLLLRPILNAWLTLAALSLPVLLAVSFASRRIFASYRWSLAFAGACILMAAIATFQKVWFDPHWIFPWLPNTFTMTPYLTGSTPIPPIDVRATLSWPFWKGFSVLLMILAFTAGALALLGLLWPPGIKLRALARFRQTSPPLVLFGLFAAGYIPLLVLKSLVPGGAGLFDRYLLPLVPFATFVGLRIYAAQTAKTRPPFLAWAALILAAYYGIAQTHDYFALLRGRFELTKALEAHGIPRTKIMGGFEYDSWTQITEAGYYNDPRIENPPLQYVPPVPLPFRTQYIFWQCTPVVHPVYIVSLGTHPELTTTDLPAISYRGWLPPFARKCLVQTTEPALAAVSAAR
jgi:hypothetical protein